MNTDRLLSRMCEASFKQDLVFSIDCINQLSNSLNGWLNRLVGGSKKTNVVKKGSCGPTWSPYSGTDTEHRNSSEFTTLKL